MANEVLPAGRGYVYVKTEATYNTHPGGGMPPALATTDVMYVEDFSKSYSRDDIARGGISPGHPGGFMSVPGGAHQEWSFNAEVRMKTITTATSSDVPNVDPLLKACGFVHTPGDGAPAELSHTYTLDPGNHGSFTLEAHEVDTANAQTVRTEMTGCRGNLSMSFNPGERVMFQVSGNAVYSAGIIAATGSGAAVLEYPSDKALLANASRAVLMDLDDEVVYGGGTIGAPTNVVLIRSLEIDCGMSVSEHMGLSGAAGVARVYLHGGDGPTANMVIEQVEIGDWNPWDLRDNQTPVECNFTFPQPGAASNTLQAVFYGQIVGDIDEAETDGLKTWGLTVKLRYPRDASDDAPAVGVAPSQTIVEGDEPGEGIGDNPGSTLPATVLALQFLTV